MGKLLSQMYYIASAERVWVWCASDFLHSSYDPNNNLLTMIDARGITTSYQYDVLNRQIERTFTTPGDATLSRHIENVTTRYDGNNNPTDSSEHYSDATVNVSSQRFRAGFVRDTVIVHPVLTWLRRRFVPQVNWMVAILNSP